MAVECTYCEEKINAKRGVYVKCDQCQDINLCLECYSAGAEIGEHQSDHPYELIDCGSFPIIDDSWKGSEELALLEGIELYGIGNWCEIAANVGTKDEQQCKERYMSVYIEDYLGRATWQAVDSDAYKINDHTCTDEGPLSPSLSLPQKQNIVDITRDQQIRLGYMPKRDDFEREYDNDAELVVSKLAVNANDDNELDQALKLAHINMYSDRLRERVRQKKVVLEYNLVKLFFHTHPEENDDLTNPQTVANTSTNQANTTASSFLSSALAAPSDKLTTVTNDNGSKTNNALSEPGSILSSYFSNLNKSIAEKDFNNMEEKLRIFCQFNSAPEHNQLIRNLARERELKLRIKELIKLRKNGMKRLNSNSNSNTINSNSNHINSKSLSSSMKKPSKTNTILQSDKDPETIKEQAASPQKGSPQKKGATGKNGSPTKNTKQSNTDNYDQTPLPCWRLLSESEKRLCKSLSLRPSQYISLKTLILKEHAQKKRKGSQQKSSIENIDKALKRKIRDDNKLLQQSIDLKKCRAPTQNRRTTISLSIFVPHRVNAKRMSGSSFSGGNSTIKLNTCPATPLNFTQATLEYFIDFVYRIRFLKIRCNYHR